MMVILETAGFLNIKWTYLVFGTGIYIQGQVKENIKMSCVLFSTWKAYTPLLALPPPGHPLWVTRNRTRPDPDPSALLLHEHMEGTE